MLLRSSPTPRTEQSVENIIKGLYPDMKGCDIVIKLPEHESLWINRFICPRLAGVFQ